MISCTKQQDVKAQDSRVARSAVPAYRVNVKTLPVANAMLPKRASDHSADVVPPYLRHGARETLGCKSWRHLRLAHVQFFSHTGQYALA